MGQILSCPQRDQGIQPIDTTERETQDASSECYWATVGSYWREHLPLSLANVIAWFQFAAYISMEPWLSPLFFYGSDGLSWLAFGITFAVQSIGGLAFGCLADTYGRRPAMLASFSTMLFATAAQGLTPQVNAVGTAWMISARVLQGLGTGGELGATTVYLVETIPSVAITASGLIMVSGIFGGILISKFVSYIASTTLNPQQMNDWGWRLPFLLSAALGMVTLYCTWDIEESDKFEEEQANGACENQDEQVTLWSCWRQGLLGSFGISSMFVQQTLAAGYLEDWMLNTVGIAQPIAMGVMVASQTLALGILFPATYLGDIIGVGKLMCCMSAMGAAFSVPMYWLIYQYPESMVAIAIGGVIIPGLTTGFSVGCQPWITELFPTKIRCSAVSLYFSAASATGGFAPAICNLLPSPLFPGWYSLAWGLISLLANLRCIQIHQKYLETKEGIQMAYLRESPY